MTLTRARSNGSVWTFSASTLQVVSSTLAILALMIAALTPYIEFRAGHVADVLDAAVRVEIVKVQEQARRDADLRAAEHERQIETIRRDIGDVRSDIRTILTRLPQGEGRL